MNTLCNKYPDMNTLNLHVVPSLQHAIDITVAGDTVILSQTAGRHEITGGAHCLHAMLSLVAQKLFWSEIFPCHITKRYFFLGLNELGRGGGKIVGLECHARPVIVPSETSDFMMLIDGNLITKKFQFQLIFLYGSDRNVKIFELQMYLGEVEMKNVIIDATRIAKAGNQFELHFLRNARKLSSCYL